MRKFHIIKSAKIPFYSGQDEAWKKNVNLEWKKQYKKIYSNFVNHNLISWTSWGLSMILIIVGFFIAFYAKKNIAWFKAHEHASNILFYACFLGGFVLGLVTYLFYLFYKGKLEAKIFQACNTEWLLYIVTSTQSDWSFANKNDVILKSVTKTPEQKCLIWKTVLPYFLDSYSNFTRNTILSLFRKKKQMSMRTKTNRATINVNPNLWYVFGPQINGKYKKTDFSIGSVTKHKTYDDGFNHKVVIITTFDCVSFQLPYKSKLKTIIKPEKKLDLVAKYEAKKQGLESSEFEKKYKLSYDQPIELRKLLQPKVMADILNRSDLIKFFPSFYIDNQQITICLNKRRGRGGLLKPILKRSKTKNEFLIQNTKMIFDTWSSYEEAIKWIKIFM